MITVHHLENSRSQRVLWLLEELGLPYEIEHYKRDPKTMLAPDSLLGSALGGLLRSSVGTTRIKMSPLDAPEVARLMEITAGVAPSSEVAQRVRARAGGNPLFVVELARP